WQSADLRSDLFELKCENRANLGQLILSQLAVLLEGESGDLHFESDHMLRAETRIDLQEVLKAPQQETCADKRNQSHSNFGDNEKIVGAAAASGAGTFGAILENSGEVCLESA